MKVHELEDKVWALDNIRIVVRDSENAKTKEYKKKRGAQANWRITEFLQKRIEPLVKGREVVVIMGDGEYPHGRTLLSSIRQSYKAK